jgi:hypothetical protein
VECFHLDDLTITITNIDPCIYSNLPITFNFPCIVLLSSFFFITETDTQLFQLKIWSIYAFTGGKMKCRFPILSTTQFSFHIFFYRSLWFTSSVGRVKLENDWVAWAAFRAKNVSNWLGVHVWVCVCLVANLFQQFV